MQASGSAGLIIRKPPQRAMHQAGCTAAVGDAIARGSRSRDSSGRNLVRHWHISSFVKRHFCLRCIRAKTRTGGHRPLCNALCENASDGTRNAPEAAAQRTITWSGRAAGKGCQSGRKCQQCGQHVHCRITCHGCSLTMQKIPVCAGCRYGIPAVV